MNSRVHSMETVDYQRFPHAWFWPIACVSIVSVGGLLMLVDPTVSLHQKREMVWPLLGWQVVEIALLCAFTYQLWKRLQDGETPITPGKAVGYLFIPFYGLYWIFRVWAGYATALNAFFARHGLPQYASSKITITCTLTQLISPWFIETPIGLAMVLASWISMLVFVAHTGKWSALAEAVLNSPHTVPVAEPESVEVSHVVMPFPHPVQPVPVEANGSVWPKAAREG